MSEIVKQRVPESGVRMLVRSPGASEDAYRQIVQLALAGRLLADPAATQRLIVMVGNALNSPLMDELDNLGGRALQIYQSWQWKVSAQQAEGATCQRCEVSLEGGIQTFRATPRRIYHAQTGQADEPQSDR